MDGKRTYSDNVYRAIATTLKKLYGISIDELNRKVRTENMVFARFICISVYKELTNESQTDVASRFKRDRSTIYYAMDTTLSERKYNKKFRYDYDLFMENVLSLIQTEGREFEPSRGYKYWTIGMERGVVKPVEVAWDGGEDCLSLLEMGLIFEEESDARLLCLNMNNVVKRNKKKLNK